MQSTDEVAQAVTQCQAALDACDSRGVLPSLQAAQLQPAQRPALIRQLLLLRLLRAVAPEGDWVSEAQLTQALHPLKPLVARTSGAAGAHGIEPMLFRQTVLAQLWQEAGRGRRGGL